MVIAEYRTVNTQRHEIVIRSSDVITLLCWSSKRLVDLIFGERARTIMKHLHVNNLDATEFSNRIKIILVQWQ